MRPQSRSAPSRARRKSAALRPSAEALESRLMMAADAVPAPMRAAIADARGPAVRAIRGPAAGTYASGEALTFRVVFDEPVRVTGSPTLPVEIGLAVRQAELVGGPRRTLARSLDFRTTVDAGASDADGIALGTVGVRDGSVVRLLAGADGIRDRAGNAADPALPTLGAGRVLVDAVAPGVRSFGFQGLDAGTIRAGRRIVAEVKFDRPVTVAGRATIPFRIGDRPLELAYAGGSGSRTLRFEYRADADTDPRAVAFREGLGEVIELSGPKAAIRDRRGNEASYVRGPSGEILEEGGRRIVVLGAHYQLLRRVGVDELNQALNVDARAFVDASDPPESYRVPAYQQATHAVDLYKVTYNSTIPEQGGRATLATGLAAIPVPTAQESAAGGAIARPMVSYQHGTVYGLHQVPSYAFPAVAGGPSDLGSYETRLAVAQFAGRGFVVIAADYFGMGDSPEADSYAVKQSEQQACLDLLLRSSGLVRSRGVEATDLLLSGWSQGGLVTMSFLQKLEERGIKVAGASTASAPSDVLAATSAMLFHRRGATDPVPDAVWLNTIFVIAAFSYETYYDRPGLALDFFNPQYYDACRRVYAREYDHLGFDPSAGDLLVYASPGDADPARIPADLRALIRPEVFDPAKASGPGPRFYPSGEFARLLREASSFQWVIQTPVQLNYGTDDEAFSPAVALIPSVYQEAINARNPIEPVPVAGGNHRGTFLTAVDNQRYWFNVLLGRDPGPRPAGFPPA
ncbi:hypothetical protein TA3x_001686 [Tundrisphaera sp. TA3]|uniref:hypothetical protein n=1 Tax=Tundrisphaera sp. TA3 TaxID=3435775 RepID=UPI003EC046A8